MTWFEDWADEPYIDMTDGLLYLPQCTDSDCLMDPHGCLSDHPPEFDYAQAPRLLLRTLDGRGTGIRYLHFFNHLRRRKLGEPKRYIRMVLLARASQVRIFRPMGSDACETNDPKPPAILRTPFPEVAPFVANAVLEELLPPVCENCGSFTT